MKWGSDKFWMNSNKVGREGDKVGEQREVGGKAGGSSQGDSKGWGIASIPFHNDED